MQSFFHILFVHFTNNVVFLWMSNLCRLLDLLLLSIVYMGCFSKVAKLSSIVQSIGTTSATDILILMKSNATLANLGNIFISTN
jgi:hypothetical protein